MALVTALLIVNFLSSFAAYVIDPALVLAFGDEQSDRPSTGLSFETDNIYFLYGNVVSYAIVLAIGLIIALLVFGRRPRGSPPQPRYAPWSNMAPANTEDEDLAARREQRRRWKRIDV